MALQLYLAEHALGCDMAGRRLANSGMHAEWKHCQHVVTCAYSCTLVLHATLATAWSCFGKPRHRDLVAAGTIHSWIWVSQQVNRLPTGINHADAKIPCLPPMQMPCAAW